MHPEPHRAEARNGIKQQSGEAKGTDPYLIAAVKTSRNETDPAISEDMAVVCDELGATATRRRAALLQLQGKNLTGDS